MDFEEIKKLVELVELSDISHLTLDENGSKIEIKKEKAQAITTVALPQEAPVAEVRVIVPALVTFALRPSSLSSPAT